MDTDAGKIFIGGISWETGEDRLKEYFNGFGEVTEVVIMKDRVTGRARGFGFVVFADPLTVDRVVTEKHSIDGRMVEAKRAVPRSEQHNAKMTNFGNNNQSSNYGGGSQRTKKIFVGGLPANVGEDDFRNYFSQFGTITDVVVMYDQTTQRPRGFGFITFDTEDAVENVLQKTFHQLSDKLVEVKRALPKDAAASGGGGGAGRGAGGYQGSSNYDNRGDNSRYGQPPAGRGGGYPSYGPSGYGSGYGSYGQVPTGGGYGYGNYGMNSYGGAPPAAAGYGNSGGGYGSAPVPSAGYGVPPAGAPRAQWNSQGAPSYGAQNNAAGYGANAGYGTSGPWPASGPTGQSPSGANGYANANYGYGSGYPNSEAPYNNGSSGYGGPARGGAPTSYGAGNDQPGAGAGAGAGAGGYSGGYGEGHANSGYAEPGWKSGGSDPSLGGYSGPAGGGYGGAPHPEGAVNGGGPASYGGYGGPGRQNPRQ